MSILDIRLEQSRGYFELVCRAVEACFLPPNQKSFNSQIEAREIFIESKLLKLWCDCSDNFEYNRLKKIMIKQTNSYGLFKKEDDKRAFRTKQDRLLTGTTYGQTSRIKPHKPRGDV